MDYQQMAANRQVMANQRGLPPLEPGEVRCPDCYAPILKRTAHKHRLYCSERNNQAQSR